MGSGDERPRGSVMIAGQQIEMEARSCACGCGRTIRVLTTSKTKYASYQCAQADKERRHWNWKAQHSEPAPVQPEQETL